MQQDEFKSEFQQEENLIDLQELSEAPFETSRSAEFSASIAEQEDLKEPF